MAILRYKLRVMNGILPILRPLGVFALLLQTAAGVEQGWEEGLARAFSGRLREIESELAAPTGLQELPAIPIDDQGGTGGWAGVHGSEVPAAGTVHAVEIRWPESANVDWVALVPARRYGAGGLDAQYGMPDAFTVELIDAAGAVVRVVAGERRARSHPVRKGHPFVYQVSPPVEAAGLRIVAGILPQDSEDSGSFVHAWAEVFAFDGGRDLARGAKVAGIGGSQPPAPWHWAPEFLVDGQTPLGLPEIPADGHQNVGWLSEGRAAASEAASVTVDLGESAAVEAVRLLPAKRPTSDLPSGFGFPRRLEISVSETGGQGDWRRLAQGDFRNPGHNPVLVPLAEGRGRYVRIEAVELWKAFESYPAFFALSEVEVLSVGRNLALRKVVRSSDGMQNLIAPGGRFWTSAALSDGFGPDGRLVPIREWLTGLDQRLRIETRRYELRNEAARLVAGWRRAGLTAFALTGLAGAFALIALPIRYRIHANRELHRVRERIAGDLHDEVGSNLGSIQMLVDLAEGRSGPSQELKRIQRIAAETVSAVRDIVWLLRSEGDHRIATVEHLRETSSIMLESLDWKFVANDEAWGTELPEESNRDLFLFFREALHNILRHARATAVEIRAEQCDRFLRLIVHDNGCGIPPERMERPATLRALRQRAAALGAELQVASRPDEGTRLELFMPLGRRRGRRMPKRESGVPAASV
jgi:signal transduction histidine kinase